MALLKMANALRNQLAKVTSPLGYVAVVLLFLLVASIAPMCAAYDLNTWVNIISPNKHFYIAWYHPLILVFGILFSEIWIPLALVTWLLSVVGAI